MELRWPSPIELPGYVDALRRGWSPNTMDDGAGEVELVAIDRDPTAFLASLVDRTASGRSISLPDGSTAERIPGFRTWMWDGEFCGSIGFRWQPGTEELPPHVLGHVGYSVVPWKRRRGHATAAARACATASTSRPSCDVWCLTPNVTGGCRGGRSGGDRRRDRAVRSG